MTRRRLRCWLPSSVLSATVAVLLGGFLYGPRVGGAAPVHYRFTFPEPEHHWMQVEASFTEIAGRPLELRMSRSSPGRYSIHDFAKNVYDVRAAAPDGRELLLGRSDDSGWTLEKHGDAVVVKYRVYGDTIDGTYLAIDSGHAHINMPAAIMWARGLDDRPDVLTFEPPRGVQWTAATQLHAGSAPYEFTAPNLQYLMDSPTELGTISVRSFTSGSKTFRFALHHTGMDPEADAFVKDVERIVAQEGAIYGEFPEYEPGSYTFIADYLPYARGDGMEHRNGTVMTSSGSIGSQRAGLLGTVAHEFFHCWNVERIRPKSLEPFDLDRANMSAELWLAEGFTQYYGPLVLKRAGLVDLASTVRTLTRFIEGVELSPGRLYRSAEDMSRMAPFIDGGQPNDRTNWSNTVTSYYTFGGAIALALDLSLRDRSDGKVSLDDYMRAMWRVHGKPGGRLEGYVDRPYTTADAEARLAEVSGDAAFAQDFFRRYINGHDVADYKRLLARAGFSLRHRNPGRAWWGDLRLESRGSGVYVSELVAPTAPAYSAGVEQDDEIRMLDGERIGTADQATSSLQRHKPGDRVRVVIGNRSGGERTATVVLTEDPRQDVIPVEAAGAQLTAEQKAFRDGWLGPK